MPVSFLGCSYSSWINSWAKPHKNTSSEQYVTTFLDADSDSCLKDWGGATTIWHNKAIEYAQRLGGLDDLQPEDRTLIFDELARQIVAVSSPHADPRRVKPLSAEQCREILHELSADQCKTILQALHNSNEINSLLNNINFKAVHYYDSERAKGKVAALCDYMSYKTEVNNFQKNHYGDTRFISLQEQVEGALRNIEKISSQPSPATISSSSQLGNKDEPQEALSTFVSPAPSFVQRTPVPAGQVSKEQAHQFLREGVQQKLWTSDEAAIFVSVNERLLCDCIKDLNYLIDPKTISNYQELSTAVGRAASRLSCVKSSRLQHMIRQFLRVKLADAVPEKYQQTIDSLILSLKLPLKKVPPIRSMVKTDRPMRLYSQGPSTEVMIDSPDKQPPSIRSLSPYSGKLVIPLVADTLPEKARQFLDKGLQEKWLTEEDVFAVESDILLPEAVKQLEFLILQGTQFKEGNFSRLSTVLYQATRKLNHITSPGLRLLVSKAIKAKIMVPTNVPWEYKNAISRFTDVPCPKASSFMTASDMPVSTKRLSKFGSRFTLANLMRTLAKPVRLEPSKL